METTPILQLTPVHSTNSMLQVPNQSGLKVIPPLSPVDTATATKSSMITKPANVSPVSTATVPTEPLEVGAVQSIRGKSLPFIEANTIETSLEHLRNDCIIPVFSKDNELTISHPNFIEAVWDAANQVFPNERIEEPFNVGMNLKVTKKFFKERIQLALFVDHLFSYKHEYRGLNGVLVRQMSEMPYFGMEINFNL